MRLFRAIVLMASLVGLAAGLMLTVVQQFGAQPLIVRAEALEAQGGTSSGHDDAHEHAAGTTAHSHEADHAHDPDAWKPADGAERLGLTLLANVLSGVGFALLLIAASELKGGLASWREGLLWGLAGFAVFTLAPSIGLPPAAPGVESGPLLDRQVWWLGTAAATAGGLALIAYGRSVFAAVAGVLLIAAPHVVGAPQPPGPPTIPHDLAHSFAVAVIVTGLLFWATLGTLAGLLRRRFAGV
jgi:cobalt transporter subunit CbtA